MRSHFILYVDNQKRSRDFYASVLHAAPTLDVPGMTEFELGTDIVLGLMPIAAIRRLIGSAIPDPNRANGIPRCELYLVVSSASEYHARALHAGAEELRPLEVHDCGHRVAYCLDQDGHILAFTERV